MATVHVSPYQKKAKELNAALVFEDEASFRQDSTLHATWSRVGKQPLVPVTGARKSVKIFGSVDVYQARFHYRREPVFNAETYLNFLEQIAKHYYGRHVIYIQDNASYHKDAGVWQWFKANRSWLEVFNLPPYSPEFNAAEPLWHHTRKSGTHNRYFNSEDEVFETLTRVFRSMQRNPRQIDGYLRPFR